MRVILTRHYQTVANAEGRIMGWGDSPPHPGWMDDVDFIATQLRAIVDRIDTIYSSDLQRAQQTAKAYASIFGVDEPRPVPDLKEINYGNFQTREKSWVYNHYPEHKRNPRFVYPAGESFLQMQERCVRFLSSLIQANADSTILIVSHAGVIRALLSHFLGVEYGSCLKYGVPFRYIGDLVFANGSCVRYEEPGDISGFVQAGVIDIPYVEEEPDQLSSRF